MKKYANRCNMEQLHCNQNNHPISPPSQGGDEGEVENNSQRKISLQGNTITQYGINQIASHSLLQSPFSKGRLKEICEGRTKILAKIIPHIYERNRFLQNVIRKVFIIILILCTSHIFCAFPSFGLPADDVIPLVDGDYYPQVHQALITAKKSIMCVMYMANIDPKYNKGWEYNLVNDLIVAHRRGVAVTVILDQNTMFWEEGQKGKKTERRSQEAYELLKKNGVPVYYDSKDRITHNKILVIDNYITIVGSTNWTYNALKKNHEASVMIKSRSVAESFLNKLSTISKYQPK